MPDILYKNLNVHYSDTGSGKVLVFLHGFLENSRMWDKVYQTLNKNLREIGLIHCPNSLCRVLVTAGIKKNFGRDWNEFRPPA